MLLIIFFVYLAVEVYFLAVLGGIIGPLLTVVWVFGSAVFGLWLFRTQGKVAGERLSNDIAAGAMPQKAIVDHLLVLFGAFLLILPGPLGDTFGLLLLLPFVRSLVRVQAASFLQRQQHGKGGAHFSRVSNLFIYDTSQGTYRSATGHEQAHVFFDGTGDNHEAGGSQSPQDVIIDCSPGSSADDSLGKPSN